MRTTTKAGLLASVCGLLLATAPAAHADHEYYHHGGCGFFTTSDGTDSPSTRWDGEVDLAVVAADEYTWAPTGEQLTVECVLYVNGVQPGTVVLSESGTGAVAKVAPLTYYADPDDVVSLCARVTTDDDVVLACGSGPAPLLPPAAWDQIDAAEALADSTVCLALLALDGGPADQPPAFDIRSDGDLYVAGEWFWDCPPQATFGT